MKVRKLAVALALAGGLGSGVAQALGLGEIELQSFLNEPLNAEINLRKSEGVSPGDVFVNIAPQSAFERVGIDRNFFLTKLNFQVTTAPDGNLVVNVSTREPLREPYLNFLVEVTWPNGRLMREYAVLVDPPVYAEESGVQEQVSAPATQQTSQPQQQARQAAPVQTTRGAAQTRTSGARTLGPTNSADTLWTIAEQVRPNNDVTTQQTMLAIQDLNQNAFMDANINRLKRGEILRIPDESQIRSRSRAQANQEVAVQNRALTTPARTVDATADAAPDTGPGEATGSNGGDQLRLVAADDTSSRDAAEGGSAGGDGQTAGGVDAGTAVAMEELESARRENDELSGRVDDLQDQVETLQRLLELKNTQLADMQSGQADSPEGPAASQADPAQTGPDSGVATDPASSADSLPSGGPSEGPSEVASEDAAEQQEMASDASTEESATDEQAEAELAAQKPFPGNMIDAITNNFIYQVALGGGLILLLLLLLLLARRNANREKAFYDQLNSEKEGDETDSFDLTFEEDDAAVAPEDDAVAEADAYIAYGRNDQAAHTLETAISREPSRTDLRLKLLGIYADIQDRESFDKQFREIEALDDEVATEEAANIQARLEEAESMPSIDDLESQLRSGATYQGGDAESEPEPEPEDLDLDLPEADSEQEPFAETSEDVAGEDSREESGERSGEKSGEQPGDESEEDDDGLIEYDLSGFELEEGETSGSAEPEKSDEPEESFEYTLDELDTDADELETDEEDDLSLDFEFSELELENEEGLPADTAPEDSEETSAEQEADQEKAEPVTGSDDLGLDDDGELDESFLDELDAELDKVAGEDDSPEDVDGSELDDLELDVSDEDLALMEEFSESDDASPSDKPERDNEDLALDDELGLEDTLQGEEPAGPEQEVEGAEQAEIKGAEQAEEALADTSDQAEPEPDDDILPPVAADKASGDVSDLDEADLGDDDDFDFLSGTDEAATKLDLARAYVEMGDVDGARDILEEVSLEGSDEQKTEAQDLLKNLS